MAMSSRSTLNSTTEAGLVAAAAEPGMRPVHPGEIVEEVLAEGLRLSVSEAARRLRVSRQTLHWIIAGRSEFTSEMALRLGKLCGNGPDLWLALQAQYDLTLGRLRLGGEHDLIPAPDTTT
jgi:antitoxin HigA-1